MTTNRSRTGQLGVLGLAAISAASLAACGGGGGSAADAAPAPAPDSATVDPAATAALQEAVASMQNAGSFRFQSSVHSNGDTTIVGEFAGPDRVHQVVTDGTGHVTEAVFSGGSAWVKDSTGAWKTLGASAVSAASPTETFAALGRAQVTSTDGSTISFTLSGADSFLQGNAGPEPITGQVQLADGRVAQLSYHPTDGRSQLSVTVSYSDVGTPITVDVPAG